MTHDQKNIPGANRTNAQPATEMLRHIGCVSFLNSKPLIDPILTEPEIQVHLAVPSALLGLVEAGTVSTALMSVVDYHASKADLLLVPAGMIGCDGPTLTVRIFSRVPAEKIQTIYGDTDSHTSIILAQLILQERYGVTAEMLPLAGLPDQARNPEVAAMLLIGDKVVNAAPSERDYPFQLDLGDEWKKLTGLPFVFAIWMMRKDVLEGDRPGAMRVAQLLAEGQRRGASMTEALLDRHAVGKGWPRDLARRYFTEYLRYEVTPRAREGLTRFFDMADRVGLLKRRRVIEYLEIPGKL